MLGGVGNIGTMSARRRVIAAGAAGSRYARIVSESSSSYTGIYEIELYTGANQTGTIYPDAVGNMTSNTAPSPLVASSPQEFSVYLAYRTFDNSGSSFWWNIASSYSLGWYIQLDTGQTSDPILSAKVTVNPSLTASTDQTIFLRTSTTGAFSGEEITRGSVVINSTDSTPYNIG
tara:strand:+ start:2100 stop:2624 length:525 start_codon:yes stop_codon:yes gene_type:complete